MKTRFQRLALLLLVGLFLQNSNALPVSSVDRDNSTASLYESDADGKATERPPALKLPFRPKPGYVILNEKGTKQIDQQDVKTWSDILLFTEDTVQLFSDPFVFPGDPQKAADVPFSRDDVLHGKYNGQVLGDFVFIEESAAPTVYQPRREMPFQGIFGQPGDPGNGVQYTYKIYSEVPETSGPSLLWISFLALQFCSYSLRKTTRSVFNPQV